MHRGIIAIVQFLDLAAKLRRHRRQHCGRAERHAIDNDKCLQVVYRLRPRLTNGGEGDRPDINLGRIAAGLTRCRMYCGNPLFQRIDVPITREKNYTIRLLACERQRLGPERGIIRSEEHTSELQSLMRISYAVFCLKPTNITAANT